MVPLQASHHSTFTYVNTYNSYFSEKNNNNSTSCISNNTGSYNISNNRICCININMISLSLIIGKRSSQNGVTT